MEEVEFQEMYNNFRFHCMNHCAWLPPVCLQIIHQNFFNMMVVSGFYGVLGRPFCGFYDVYPNELSENK